MYRIAICDDEIDGVKRIQKIIGTYGSLNSLEFDVYIFLSGIELLREYSGYDLIFLDIDMPQMDGIEVARTIVKNDIFSKIIYVTSHKNYMRQAFSVKPFGYLLKPATEEDIFTELDEFIRRTELEKSRDEICFQSSHGVITYDQKDILYFEYVGKRRVELVSIHGKTVISYGLKDITNMMAAYPFAMPHQSFIVNLLHVEAISAFEITMMGGDKIPIAQKRARKFKLEHSDFLHSHFNF